MVVNPLDQVVRRQNVLNPRRFAMTNSLVRIGTVEGGDLVKRALAALIRSSSHQQSWRSAFEPRPNRLSIMSKSSGCTVIGLGVKSSSNTSISTSRRGGYAVMGVNYSDYQMTYTSVKHTYTYVI
ncbi:hypothetical protein L1987_58804 [Smallanthus sonchifolius]|uniref:Uncharacterized protein n=1 Tax=Smallanthus sonchifolius TaxID=185202 RepID=A0ACB9D3J1_9ASTR|nr:hypothetical protein L1987_58804 [Smallanthus sonchifolius]